ncbi:MAG: DsbA family protein [Candidatus Aenigmarchaeota archaeon]|nr:DsbA family protein [Candidatus Aenigmarchaeota archaeon]
MTLEITNTVIVASVVFLVIGYLVGNVAPIYGKSSIPTAQIQQAGTDPTAAGGTEPQQQPSQQVSLSVDDDPTMGSKDAPIIVYEFSDYQCPFCERFFSASLPQIKQNYIDTGKILFVYKDFPLTQIHPGAMPAAIYAKCANDQGKWVAFHDAVFKNQGALQQGQAGLDSLATQAGLDMTALASCASDPSAQKEVENDLNTGIAVGVTGTPSFFIGSPEKGFVNVVGAQPYDVLRQAIDQKLAE